jgi:hypothetical protein
MSVEHPYFSERFAPSDYVRVGSFHRALHETAVKNTKFFSPVLMNPGGDFNRSEQIYVVYGSGAHEDIDFESTMIMTGRWAALESVYWRALDMTRERFPLIEDVRWEKVLPNWCEIVLPECYADAVEFFVGIIQAEADKGIRISSGCTVIERPGVTTFTPKGRNHQTLKCVLDAELLSYAMTEDIHRSNHARNPLQLPTGTRTYGWDELKDLVSIAHSRDLELLNYKDAMPRSREIDRAMIKAFSSFDLEKGLILLNEGAEINAFDEYGETAFSALADAFETDYASEDDHERCAELRSIRIRGLQLLLDHGADVNLASYQESDALIHATLKSEPETVKFLLESGADPNYNPWPEEDLWCVSQALDYAATDASLERGTPEGEKYEEIRMSLEAYGAVFRREPTDEAL